MLRSSMVAAVCCGCALLAVGCHDAGGSEAKPTASGIRPCDLGRLALGMELNGLDVWAYAHVHGQRCRLRATLRVTLYRSEDHEPRKVDGNPARVRINRVVSPRSELFAAWSWHNWCGNAEVTYVKVTLANLSTTITTDLVPTCFDPDVPSELRQRAIEGALYG